MKFSREEVNLFASLAKELEVSNPRRIVRLRNSYGLMKLNWHHFLAGDNQNAAFRATDVMQALFAVDAISEWPSGHGAVDVLDRLERGDLYWSAEGPDGWRDLVERIDKAVQQHSVSSLGKCEDKHQTALFKLARLFMLPHPRMDPSPTRGNADEHFPPNAFAH